MQPADDRATPLGPPRPAIAADLSDLERRHRPRWVWADTAQVYPALFDAGVRVERCHDIRMTERLLLSRTGHWGEPTGPAAVTARRSGLPVPADRDPVGPGTAPTLFDDPGGSADPVADLTTLAQAYRDQIDRIPAAATEPTPADIAVAPGALKLLVAADATCALIAVEMGRIGLPWRADVHEAILTQRLGGRPRAGERPPILATLAAEITEAFGHRVNPDSPQDLLAAFHRAGFPVQTTRSWEIGEVDHPAVTPVLAYKELSRLLTANGWNWLQDWVQDGRFRAEYHPAGVVTGRWATRGGGALQIPRQVRSAVVADPGHRLVVADAAQLEPRVLVLISGDTELAALAGPDDLYRRLGDYGFSGDRSRAKLAMLGAMYGQTSGEAGVLVARLRESFPAAMGFVEAAARRGEQGKVVTTVLGRTSPPPEPEWTAVVTAGATPDAGAAAERRARQAARNRGRFTRNFVVQGSAADWAAVWLSCLRGRLHAIDGAELVFFQHDELIVHCPAEHAETVAAAVSEAADIARRLVFPQGRALTPVRPVIVGNYAEAK